MKKKLLLAACCLLLSGVCALCAQAAPVDASRFDILGVRLGMPQNEALTTLLSALGLDSTAVQWKRNVFTGKNDYTECTVEHGSGTYELSFFEAGAKGNRAAMIVKYVRYTIPDSPENRAALRKAAIAKYGPPSYAAYPKNSAEWCLKPDKYLSACHAYDGPRLRCEQAGVPSLTLSDPSLGKQPASAPRTIAPQL